MAHPGLVKLLRYAAEKLGPPIADDHTETKPVSSPVQAKPEARDDR